MATEFTDYRGYRLAITTPRPGESWSVMINPIEALRALSARPEAATRDQALAEAKLIVDRSLDRPPAQGGRSGWLARLRGGAPGNAHA
jgi:hypothetical protein